MAISGNDLYINVEGLTDGWMDGWMDVVDHSTNLEGRFTSLPKLLTVP
jgi:hypothetical protein